MKKCPNCGALMQSNVNFCTKCGTDLRQVNNSPKEDNRKKQVRHADSQTGGEQQEQRGSAQNEQETNFQQTMPPVKAQTANTASQGNTLVQNYWQWCVNSWKYPFSAAVSENWYGLVTILVDDLLIIFGFYFCLKSLANSYSVGGIVSNFAFSGVISLLFFRCCLKQSLLADIMLGTILSMVKQKGC